MLTTLLGGLQMDISVVWAGGRQHWARLKVDEPCTVQEAIERSGILEACPEIDLSVQKVGVFGKMVPLATLLKGGDRIEIYRGIMCDPAVVPRRRGEVEEVGG
ncbi:MAG: RnfH family protein [Rhodocyclaceae bacterium]